MPLFEDFENCVGTYLKVLRFSEPTTPDGFLVLYLRPNGRFLFAGYWSGYERSAAAGRWVRQGVEVRLDGRGRVATDAIPGPEGRRFERIFAHTGYQSHALSDRVERTCGMELAELDGPSCVCRAAYHH